MGKKMSQKHRILNQIMILEDWSFSECSKMERFWNSSRGTGQRFHVLDIDVIYNIRVCVLNGAQYKAGFKIVRDILTKCSLNRRAIRKLDLTEVSATPFP